MDKEKKLYLILIVILILFLVVITCRFTYYRQSYIEERDKITKIVDALNKKGYTIYSRDKGKTYELIDYV